MPTWAKLIPYLRMDDLKSHTLSRGTYLYIAQSFEASNRGQSSCRCTLDQWLDLIALITS